MHANNFTFTFQYVSINTRTRINVHQIVQQYLHSNMFLLIRYVPGFTFLVVIFTFQYVSINTKSDAKEGDA